MKISDLFKELYPTLTDEQAEGLQKIVSDITGRESVADRITGPMRKARKKMDELGIKDVVI